MAISHRAPEAALPHGCAAVRPTATAIGLRPESDQDLEFLRALYVSTRWDEVAVTSWPDSSKLAFLHDQFRLQHAHYRSAYYDAAFQLIVADEEPIGRLYVHRGTSEYRVVDISLMPDWRRQGIGEYLLRSVQAEAGAQRCKVSIHVEANNPAQRLYGRLGFELVEDKGIYLLFEWCDQLKSI
jgi:ribosomal protein S18 acetylase RimI-like enzyme